MRTWNVTMTAALLLAAACGDDAKGASSTSSIDSKLVSDLSTSEAKTLCEYLNSVSDKTLTLEQACTNQAINETDTKADCLQNRDQCIANHEQDPAGELEDCDTLKPNPNCTAKVSVVKACLKALIEQDDKESRDASCDALDATLIAQIPGSCTGIPTACLNF